MKLVLPDYYEDFACLGSACKQSCCIGWALEVDADSYAHYQSVPGSFGDELRAELAKGEYDPADEICTLSLTVDGRCPFLDGHNLCRIIRHLGEEALPEICSEYPRSCFICGDVMERTLLLSCEEAARLLFSQKTLPVYQSHKIAGDAKDPLSCEEAAFYDAVCAARSDILRCLSATDIALSDRLYQMMLRVTQVDGDANAAKGDPLLLCYAAGSTSRGHTFSSAALPGSAQVYDAFLLRLSILSGLEVLNEDWASCMRDFAAFFGDAQAYEDALVQLLRRAPDWEADAARFLSYLIFRNFSPAIYDGRFFLRMRYILFCLLLLRDIDALLVQKNGGRFTFSDRITSVSLFSREIEHSDINPDIILDELLFS